MAEFWKSRSLRFWVALGMFVALAPITASAILGYVILNRGVIVAFHDVAVRQVQQVGPLQHLRLLVWDAVIPVDEYVDEGGVERPLLYRELRGRIETAFVTARTSLTEDEAALLHLDNALASWGLADAQATELTSVFHAPGDPVAARAMERFHGHITATSDRLGQVYDNVATAIETDHQVAIGLSQRAELVLGAALVLSLVAVGAGVATVGAIMTRSVDRLVDGAARFASGDRHHRIEISVPPELNRVAEEFNRMITRIEQSETALADLARIDGLTQLHNRRAFDEEMERRAAALERGGDSGALLTLDIDHFKSVNDTYGHAAGDEVLRRFARVLGAGLRPMDKPYRVGGEEFAIILPRTEVDTAMAVAERLRQAVAAEVIILKDATISVTVSVGVAPVGRGIAPAEILQAADAALYRAKLSGRNRVIAASAGDVDPPGPVPLALSRQRVQSL